MMNYKILVILALVLAVESDPDSGLVNFMEYKIANGFSTWMAENGRDPAPPMITDIELNMDSRLLSLNGTFSNITLTGLSNPVAFYNTGTSFLSGMIYIRLTLPASMQGVYSATGTVLDLYPIGATGMGMWKRGSELYEELVFNYPVATFEGLLTPETVSFENDIHAEIVSGLEHAIPCSTGDCLTLAYPHVFDYLQAVFSTTPAEEIINWQTTTTMPPTTQPTTTRSPTTTMQPTTTRSPTTTYTPDTTTMPTSSSRPCMEEIKWEDWESRSEGLNNFLKSIFEAYPEWLRSNQLDPTPPIPSPITLDINSIFLSLSGAFGNTRGSGLSNLNEVFLSSVHSDLLVPSFDLNFRLVNVTIYGNYFANGSIISLYPISGEGDWSIRREAMDFELSISGFDINEIYFNIDKFENRSIVIITTNDHDDVSIPDLVTPEEADGLGQEVLTILGDLIPTLLQNDGKHPVIKSVLDYLKFKFDRTPITEIIGTTRPPCFY